MEAVGYDMYCKMLNEAVQILKGEKPVQEEFDTTIDLQVDAFIPASYIKSEYQKLDMYKRIAGVENDGERSDVEDELVDRFGEIPSAVQNLLRIAVLKAQAHLAGLQQVCQKPDGIRFYFRPNAKIVSEKIPDMLESYQGRLKYIAVDDGYFLYKMKIDISAGRPKSKQEVTEKIFRAAEGVVAALQEITREEPQE